MAVSAPALRRTQAERTAVMRERLLEATAECLAELGYAGTTTTEVVRRAGVSRGAQVHHFPTKNDLVVGALDHILAMRQEEFRVAFGALEPEERTLAAAVDLLWSMYRSPTFASWLELAVAFRTDRDLRARFLEVNARFFEQCAVIFGEFFESPDPRFSRIAVAFAFAVLDGLATQHAVGIEGDAPDVLGLLKDLATMFAPEVGGSR
jgi:AcrR family transcriptional regulator